MTRIRTYCPVTRADFEDIRNRFAADGIELPNVDTHDGVDATHGFTVGWTFKVEPAPNLPWLQVRLSKDSDYFWDSAWNAIEGHLRAKRIS